MKRQAKFIRIVLIFLLVGSLGILFLHSFAKPEPSTSQSETKVKEIAIDASGFVGKTALEATRLFLNGNIQAQGEGANAYVVALNGRVADSTKNEFWELIINDQSAQVGAGSYVIKHGDSIIWRLSTF